MESIVNTQCIYRLYVTNFPPNKALRRLVKSMQNAKNALHTYVHMYTYTHVHTHKYVLYIQHY